jgi:uncharacterized protein (DUF58 family)
MFDVEFLRKLEYLDVVARKILAGRIRADRLSSRRGTSVEFEDFRQYAVGDDLRYVDWNVFGRLEEFFLKLYKEEENLHLTVLLDTSASMRFGQIDKFDYGRKVAAAIAYIGMSNLDDANVHAYGPDIVQSMGRMRGKGKVRQLFEFLTELQAAGETDMKRSFRRFIGQERRRGIVVVVSDLYDVDGVLPALRYLQSRRHEIYVVHVTDRSEAEPELRGDLRLVDAESGVHRDLTITDSLRQKYRDAFEAHAQNVSQFCRQKEIGYVRAWTDITFDELVLRILKRGGLVA